jgi:hypothetical protein
MRLTVEAATFQMTLVKAAGMMDAYATIPKTTAKPVLKSRQWTVSRVTRD